MNERPPTVGEKEKAIPFFVLIICGVVVTFLIFLTSSRLDAKKPEGVKEFQGHGQEVRQQPLETKEIQHGRQREPSLTLTVKENNQKETSSMDGSLTEEEQERFNGGWPTLDEEIALYFLRILIKGDEKTIRWYSIEYEKNTEEERRMHYESDICGAIDSLNARKSGEAANIMLEVLKRKNAYPRAMACAARGLRATKDRNLIPLLREKIKSKNQNLRLEAAGSLLTLGDSDTALPVLDMLAKEGEPVAISFIIDNLEGKGWEKRGLEVIKGAMDYRNNEIKTKIAWFLFEKQKDNDKAKEMALKVIGNLKDKRIEDYGLGRRKVAGQNYEETFVLPGYEGKTKSELEKPYHSDSRACSSATTLLYRLNSADTIPSLDYVYKRNREWRYVCKGEDALETLLHIQISHCIEPEFRRFRRPIEEGRPSITSELSNTGILLSGFVFSLERLLESIKITVREVRLSEVSPQLVKDIPTLMVAGGALSERFPELGYERLKSYVRNGGTLIVFSQPKGISYSKLMEGVEALGYEEDRTPNYMEVVIADDHEMFAGLLKRSFVMAVDGHFKKYPERGRVHLKRAKLNQPIFLSSPFGKGTIIATTSFTPEEFENGSATEDEIIFFREVLNYFRLPMALPKVKAGQNVKLKIKVKNEDKEGKATKGVVMIYDPERAHQRFRKEFPINLKPGDSTFIEFTYPTCSTAPSGIWHTTYELMTEGYQLLTSEQEPKGVNVWLESLLQPQRDCLEGRFVVIK